jgi:hypothetical protein
MITVNTQTATQNAVQEEASSSSMRKGRRHVTNITYSMFVKLIFMVTVVQTSKRVCRQ